MIQKLKDITYRFKKEVKFYRSLSQDTRIPLFPKILLGIAIGYAVLPFDLIPDFIPVLGQLDDVIIIPLLIIAALKCIPKDILDSHKIEN